MISKNKSAPIFALLLLIFFQNCITTYRDFPAIDSKIVPQENTTKETVFFKVTRFPNLSWNEEDVKKALIAKGWKEIENYPPEKGYYINVQSIQKDPSLMAVLFLYLSYATFTILPSYSGKDGANVKFSVYKDGQKYKDYDYEITRKSFVWILTLPVIWINLQTYNEIDAYKAVVDKFDLDFRSSKF